MQEYTTLSRVDLCIFDPYLLGADHRIDRLSGEDVIFSAMSRLPQPLQSRGPDKSAERRRTAGSLYLHRWYEIRTIAPGTSQIDSLIGKRDLRDLPRGLRTWVGDRIGRIFVWATILSPASCLNMTLIWRMFRGHANALVPAMHRTP